MSDFVEYILASKLNHDCLYFTTIAIYTGVCS